MSISITVDAGVINGWLNPGGMISDDMGRRALRCDAKAKSEAPVDTGRMRASGYVAPTFDIPGAWEVVFPVGYAIYVNNGTRFMHARPFLTNALLAAV